MDGSPENFSALLQRRQPLVVGSAGSQKAIKPLYVGEECDIIELRLDCLGNGEDVHQFVESHRNSLPLILTARHPDEGGSNGLSARRRAELLSEFLPTGGLLDLELQSIGTLKEVWETGAESGLLRIASWHDFDRCPSSEQLRNIIREMSDAGADIAKCAFKVTELSDLQRIPDALEAPPIPLSIMGMGPLASCSRLLAAQLGSALNYGYLGEETTAPGQWSARLLREAISSLAEA